MDISDSWRRSLACKLLAWFDESARDLPWRRTRDLYAIWVSEVMLQQTQVATVIPYFEQFLDRFPTAGDLAAADEQDVLRLWEGLGYYRRARQLHAAARRIATEHSGQFPQTFDDVRALPGIGRYTAGAILSIGLDQRLPILEANSIRVLSRMTGFTGDVTSTAGQKHLWSVAEAVLPAKRCGAFNQALMELGSEVCRPKAPECGSCPVRSLCAAHRQGMVEQIPRAPAKTVYEEVTEVAVIVRDRGRVLLRHCQPGERWAGLWDFPRFAARAGAVQNGCLSGQIADYLRPLTGRAIAGLSHLTTLKHGVTRFRITLHCYEAKLAVAAQRRTKPPPHVRWVRPVELAEYPLCVTGRKISRLISPPS
jgi:A/G-specific adenine glycosylase